MSPTLDGVPDLDLSADIPPTGSLAVSATRAGVVGESHRCVAGQGAFFLGPATAGSPFEADDR